ncbi:MAG: hypothetical protein N2444_06435, partial [Methylocystis sp.]|nr:hypothetical protein [Methylocystis sp.]
MSNHRNDFTSDFFVPDHARDPVKAARDPARVLPRRFYKEAVAAPVDHAAFGRNRPNAENVIDSKSVERALSEKPDSTFSQRALFGGFGVTLDGRPVNTPAKRRLVVPSQALAEALAREWAAQGEKIDPTTMPLTKLVNSALDGVAGQMEAVEAEIVKYAGSDMICYRAGEPEGLVKAQAEAWDPLVAFAQGKLGARLALAQGVMFVEQPDEAIAAIAAAVRSFVGASEAAPLRLAALHVATTLSGSA